MEYDYQLCNDVKSIMKAVMYSAHQKYVIKIANRVEQEQKLNKCM